MIIKTYFIALLLSIASFSFGQQKIRIRINDSTYFDHEVILKKNDTINGKVIAVYANDTSIIAYEKSYYQGYQNGNYKIYFPNGKLMEWTIYQKNKKNGDYTLYDITGTILIKGKFLNDLRHGYWAYRTYKLYGKFKNDKKHGKWKWYFNESAFYVYKYNLDELLSVSPKNNAPNFPEYILKQ